MPEQVNDVDDDVDEEAALEAPEVEINLQELSQEELSELDPSEVDLEQLDDQEWDLGGSGREFIKFTGHVFLVEGADEDVILNLIASAAMAGQEGEDLDESGSDRMYQYVNSAVAKPEITPERWRNMKKGERIGLTMRIAEFDGIHHLMDFPGGGPSPPQAE